MPANPRESGVVVADHPVRFICSEVWGGNMPVEAELTLPGMLGWVYSRPCGGGNGGDVNYFSTCSAGLITRACLADVVGHGDQVARVSRWIHELLRKHMNDPNPRRILEGLNRRVSDEGFNAMTTVAFVSYYASKGKLRYGYAGHPPVLYRPASNGRWTSLIIENSYDDAGIKTETLCNAPLGVEHSTDFEVGICTLYRGDRLVMFSDGITETASPAGEQFGAERLTRCLADQDGDGPAETGRAILDALHAFSERDELEHDDVSLVVLDVVDRPRGPAMFHMLRNQSRRLLRRMFRQTEAN